MAPTSHPSAAAASAAVWARVGQDDHVTGAAAPGEVASK